MEEIERQYVRFDKSMTSIIKGFAIIFMMLLHCYASCYYDAPLDYDHSIFSGVNGVFKICVGMFTFMVGYGYSFSKNKDLKYSLQHIIKLLIPFWTILFLFTFPFCYTTIASTKISVLLFNLVGIDSTFNYFSWFVYYYIFTMIVLPFVSRFIDHRPVRNSVISVITTVLLSVIVHEIPRIMSLFGISMSDIVEYKPLMALFFSLSMFAVTILGYLFAHNDYFERIEIGHVPKMWICVISILVIIVTLTIRYYMPMFLMHLPFQVPFQFDFFLAPPIIAAIVVFFNKFTLKPIRNILMKMGEVSVYMWFFHALFYTKDVRWFYQPAITIFRDINVVVLWTIVLTFFASWLIKAVVDRIISYATKNTLSQAN